MTKKWKQEIKNKVADEFGRPYYFDSSIKGNPNGNIVDRILELAEEHFKREKAIKIVRSSDFQKELNITIGNYEKEISRLEAQLSDQLLLNGSYAKEIASLEAEKKAMIARIERIKTVVGIQNTSITYDELDELILEFIENQPKGKEAKA